MAYVSLYRKYRSQTFEDLIGQDHVVRTLQNAIQSGRVSHSYLFTGPRGTGKTSTARLLAKALCCENGPSAEPDNTCHICVSITNGSCVDVQEMDAASESGVDDIREQIVESVDYQPMVARYKIYIIDEVHDLSPRAFDALLKTIEEPPAHVVFILATTEYNKVPPTIRSRCQKFEFHRAGMANLISRLEYVVGQEGLTAEPTALAAIARMADGGYRDALTLLEQAMLTSEDNRIELKQVYDQLGLVAEDTVDRLLVAMRNAEITQIMDLLEEIARLGRDPRSLLESMLYRLSDLTRAAYRGEPGGDATRDAVLFETAASLGKDHILRFRSDLAEAHKVIRDISLPRLWLESELVRMATARPSARPAEAPSRPAAAPVAPRPRPEPKIEPAKPAKAEEVSKPVVHMNGEDRWEALIDHLNNQSKTLAMKLSGARAAKDDDSLLLIEFKRETEHSWVVDRPKAVAMVTSSVQAVYGSGFQVEFRVNKEENSDTGPGSVELPLEGKRLEQLLKESFGEADRVSDEQVTQGPT